MLRLQGCSGLVALQCAAACCSLASPGVSQLAVLLTWRLRTWLLCMIALFWGPFLLPDHLPSLKGGELSGEWPDNDCSFRIGVHCNNAFVCAVKEDLITITSKHSGGQVVRGHDIFRIPATEVTMVAAGFCRRHPLQLPLAASLHPGAPAVDHRSDQAAVPSSCMAGNQQWYLSRS